MVTDPDPAITALIARIQARAADGRRVIVAVAGAPGSGKSTLAERLARGLGAAAAVMPMDGYHMDNAVLEARVWRAVKGAPQTFDAEGFAQDLGRIRADAGAVLVPVFDRRLDLSRGAARSIDPDVRIVVVEGNYLLLDQAPWSDLVDAFDLTVFLDVAETVLEARLVQRWLDHGHDPEAALARAQGNDLPNARLVAAQSRPADVVITGGQAD